MSQFSLSFFISGHQGQIYLFLRGEEWGSVVGDWSVAQCFIPFVSTHIYILSSRKQTETKLLELIIVSQRIESFFPLVTIVANLKSRISRKYSLYKNESKVHELRRELISIITRRDVLVMARHCVRKIKKNGFSSKEINNINK